MRLSFAVFCKTLVELRGGVKIFDFANDTCVKIAEIFDFVAIDGPVSVSESGVCDRQATGIAKGRALVARPAGHKSPEPRSE